MHAYTIHTIAEVPKNITLTLKRGEKPMPKRKEQNIKYCLPEYTGSGIKLILLITMLETFILTDLLNVGKN